MDKQLKDYMKQLGARGGKARAKSLNRAQLSDIGKLGASKRWPNSHIPSKYNEYYCSTHKRPMSTCLPARYN